jgi:hypothetical protein
MAPSRKALTVTIWTRWSPHMDIDPGSTVAQTIADDLALYLSEGFGSEWCSDAVVHVQDATAPQPAIPSKEALDSGREDYAFVECVEEVSARPQ